MNNALTSVARRVWSYLFREPERNLRRELSALLLGCAGVVYSLAQGGWGSGLLHPPYDYAESSVGFGIAGVALILVAGASLLPVNWRGVAGLLRIAGLVLVIFGITAGMAGSIQRQASEKASTVEVVREAYKTTEDAGSARVSLRETISGLSSAAPGTNAAPMPERITMAGGGVVDFASGDMRVKIHQKTKTPSPRSPRIGGVEMRKVGHTVYEKLPAAMSGDSRAAEGSPLAGKRWMKIDLDAFAEEEHGAGFSRLQNGQRVSPLNQLAYLKKVSDSVEKVGAERVRGAPTTHYKAVIDLEKAASRRNGKAEKSYTRLEKRMGTTRLPIQVWLDGQGRVRRYKMDMRLPPPASQGGPQSGEAAGEKAADRAHVSVTEEFYSFGVPVHVGPPPASQTADLSKAVGRSTGRYGSQGGAAATVPSHSSR